MRKIVIIFSVLLFCISSIIAQQKKYAFEEKIAVKRPLAIKAATFEGNINVLASDINEVILTVAVTKKGKSIELTKDEFVEHFKFSFNKSDTTIEISTSTRQKEKKYWCEEIEASYELKVPLATSCNLYTMKGNIGIEGLSDIQKCVTSDGNIEAEKIKGGLLLETSNGNIFLKDIEGSVFANTTNGKIQGNINFLKDSAICNSDNGTINIIIPGDTKASIFLKGKLVNSSKVNFDGTYERTLVSGRMNGGGIPVRMVGKNGNVSLFYK